MVNHSKFTLRYFGMTPKGDILRLGSGGSQKGPAWICLINF